MKKNLDEVKVGKVGLKEGEYINILNFGEVRVGKVGL